ncbi:MAG: hypothetical protein E7294_07225 [Lachnospiraceae bacterium]|jgi:drug/metabolite transporter (DMT)-like permease|nr:hypothetical protein [Lachnospiraceae bacterium]
MWMLLVLVYGLLKGTREIVKKKSLERSSVMEVLFFYTLFAFLFVCPDMKNAMGMKPSWYFFVALKSFVIFLAWMCSFKAIKKMPLSVYGILDLSRVLFATLLGTVVLREKMSTQQIIGLILVASGLLLLKMRIRTGKNVGEREETERTKRADAKELSENIPPLMLLFALASCLLNALSGLMDKLLMKDLNSSQLQFWYMLFLVSFYLIYILVTKEKIDLKKSLKNYWIWILAFLFVIADRALFVANGMADSRVTVMTLIKQSGCIVTILGGRFIYKEKNIGFKLFCAGVIITGIVVAVL